jgi:hypothetical protein
MSQHHDPVHPDSEHLTPEVLADLDVGLLDAESAERARHHLAHCQTCTTLNADLAELTTSLGELPTPTMPDALWERLEAAVAAEPVSTPTGAATVVPIDAQRKRRMLRPGIGVVAGIAAVALVGAGVLTFNNTGGTGDSTASSGGVGETADRTTATVPMAAYSATRSGTKYQPDQLDHQVLQLVAHSDNVEVSGGATPEPSQLASATASATAVVSPSVSPSRSVSQGHNEKNLPSMAYPTGAQACLENYLNQSGVVPLAIDIGTWEGQPAAVIVLPGPDPTTAQVWVIDPDCGGPTDPLIYFATIDR